MPWYASGSGSGPVGASGDVWFALLLVWILSFAPRVLVWIGGGGRGSGELVMHVWIGGGGTCGGGGESGLCSSGLDGWWW